MAGVLPPATLLNAWEDIMEQRVVALEIEIITKQYDLEIAPGGIDHQILMSAIEKVSEQGAKGGVREISRNIEKKIADGLVDAKLAEATHVRFVAEGEKIKVIPVGKGDAPSGSPAPAAVSV
jgi:ATP-dependent Clp protease ATP-binding subunit ClpA